MRILLLSQWFDPEPAVFKGLTFARALLARGHEVRVVTGFPNFPEGRLYPGYRVRPFQCEIMDDVTVLRVPLFPSHSRSRIGRSANYLSFCASAGTIGAAFGGAADVIYAYHPPATIGVAAAAIGIVRRAPIVLDVQDLWPDSLAATGMVQSPRVLHLLGRLCAWNYRRAARVVVLSEGFRTALEERGVPAEKLRVIYNWSEEVPAPERDPAWGRELGLDGRFNVVFAGTMGLAQRLDAVLAAAARCSALRPDIQFVFVGGGVDKERLERVAAEKRLPNVRFLPRQSAAQIRRTMALADALLVHLRDDPLFRITIPSKTQSYLHAGRPVIMAVRGDAAEMVTRARAGLVANPDDPVSIADAVLTLERMPLEERRMLGKNGAEFYDQHLSQREGVRRFEECFLELGPARLAGA